MLEEMDLDGGAHSPGATPQPSMVWSRVASHAHGHAHHAGNPDHDGNESADDEGTKQHVYPLRLPKLACPRWCCTDKSEVDVLAGPEN